MKSKELLRILMEDGWRKKDQKWSHLQMEHPSKKGKVIIPIHSGDIKPGTLNSILKQAGLK